MWGETEDELGLGRLTHMHTHMNTCIHTHEHTSTYMHIHICMHAHMHTQAWQEAGSLLLIAPLFWGPKDDLGQIALLPGGGSME